MRMAGPDIMLFVVGALLFGGASYALVQQGGLDALLEQRSTAGQFQVAFETHRTDVAAPVDVASFRSVEETFEINATNVAKAIFVVDCRDGQAGSVAGFTITVDVQGPNNATLSKSYPCSAGLEIPIEVAPVPQSTTVEGTTETEARANYESPNATKAQGAWTIRITGGRAAGGVPLPGQDPSAPPSGTVAMAIEHWEPRFTAVQAK